MGAPLFKATALRRNSLAGGVAALLGGAGLLAAAGPSALPLRAMIGDSVRAVLMRWFVPFVALAVLVAGAATFSLFSALTLALRSLLALAASVAAAVGVAYYLARRIGGRLDRAEERFTNVFRAAPAGMAISDVADGRLLQVNEEFLRIFGYSRGEVIGRTTLELGFWFDPKDREQVIADAVQAGTLQDVELRMRSKSGHPLVLRSSFHVSETEGRALLLSTFTDVTAHERAERAQSAMLRISDAAQTTSSLADVFAAIHRIVGGLMPARNFYIALCDAGCDLITFPYYADEVDPPPAPRKPGRGLTEYVLRTGQPLLGTHDVLVELVRRGDVELIGAPALDWLGVPLKVGDRIIGVLVVQSYGEGPRYTQADKVVLQFVSSQVAMAIERARAAAALQDNVERLRALESATTEGIMLHEDGRVIEVNDAFVRMMGYDDRAEVIGKPVLDFCAPAWKEKVRGYIREGRETPYEAEGLRKDGSIIPGEMSARPARYRGRDVRMVAIRDLTARKQLEGQLRQAQKMEAVGQLAGGVAHDFNNLLTTIIASSELLALELGADPRHKESAEAIRRAAERGAELTRDLLAFSRQQALSLRPISLGALASDFVRLARRVLPEDVQIVLLATEPQTTVRADPGAVEQILMNLVTNARDAMPGGGRLTLAVERQELDEEACRAPGFGKPGAYVVASVSDTGAGMAAAVRQRIFEPFFTTKPVGQGTGLGMSMVYGLVKQHEGFVGVDSEPERGTTVRIYLPAVHAEVSAGTTAKGFKVAGGTETVLLVEDDAALRRAATRVLEKHGYTVISAPDGFEAVNLFKTAPTPCDLIISDVVMPHRSGPQLLQALREAGEDPKILFTSGYAARGSQERGPIEQSAPFLAKPWTITELLLKVREVLDGPRSRLTP